MNDKYKYLLFPLLLVFPSIMLATDDKVPFDAALFFAIYSLINILIICFMISQAKGQKNNIFLTAVITLVKFTITLIAIANGIAATFIDFILNMFIYTTAMKIRRKITSSSIVEESKVTDDITAPTPKLEALHCPSCGEILDPQNQCCLKCGSVNKAKQTKVTIDPYYDSNINVLLKNILTNELKKNNIDIKTYSNVKSNKISRIILIITCILFLIANTLYFFNYSIYISITIVVITIILNLIINHIYNSYNNLRKKVINNPDKEIEVIVKEDIKTYEDKPFVLRRGIILATLLFLLLPTIFYIKPHILYKKVDNGYYVYKYTKGIIKEDKLVIPDKYKNKDITGISYKAFYNVDSLKEIVLPDTIKEIKGHAFRNTKKLVEINMPKELTYLGAYAFAGAEDLFEIEIPKGVTEINAYTFQNNYNLYKITLHDNIDSIRAHAFENCLSLKKIKLPKKLEYLGASSFAGAESITEIIIPKGVTEINGATFMNCRKLQIVKLHDNIKEIHGEAFMNCYSLKNITLPNNIPEVRGSTFENCTSLESIEIPDSVTRIGGHAFANCYKLSEVKMSKRVKEIGSSAFRYCNSLYVIEIPSGTFINERAFKDSPTSIRYFSRYSDNDIEEDFNVGTEEDNENLENEYDYEY